MIFAVGVLAVVGCWDFLTFTWRADAARPPSSPQADAVVSLTGGSNLRIRTGVDLVSAGIGQRLLISGAHPDVALIDVQAQAEGDAAVYACCVELGKSALSTRGNARETAAWVETHAYRSIIVVTSDYHMPRAMEEMTRLMPNLQLIPFPVRSSVDPGRPFSSWRNFQNLSSEWLKWRVTQARRRVFG
ncbi:MAG: YdcF family protein [Pseudomonadota bacterium]